MSYVVEAATEAGSVQPIGDRGTALPECAQRLGLAGASGPARTFGSQGVSARRFVAGSTQYEGRSERLCAEIRTENRFEVICRVSITSGDERPVDVHGRRGSGMPEPVGPGPHVDALGEQLGGDEVA